MRRALASFGAAGAAILAGAAAFSLTQHVSFFTAVYWAVTTATTDGYGDVVPHDTSGRIVAIVTMLTTVTLLGNAASHAHIHRHRKMRQEEAKAGGQDNGKA